MTATGADFDRRVARVVAAVPAGDVITYGQIARLAGRPGAARRVGAILHGSRGLPWWRVVHADGRLVAGLEAHQARRLRAEGVRCRGPRVERPAAPARGGGGHG